MKGFATRKTGWVFGPNSSKFIRISAARCFGALVCLLLFSHAHREVNAARAVTCWNSSIRQNERTATRHRLKGVSVEGAVHFNQHQVLRYCKLKPNKLSVVQSVSDCTRLLKEKYRKAGYTNASVEIQPTYKQDERSVDLVITIKEGYRYLVSGIEFIGNYNTRHRIIERAAGLRLGMPYDPEQVSHWIKGLNRIARFKPVKREDVEIQIDDQDHSVRITIHFTEI
jgi:outer membrane protein assembly factor BamA